MKQGLRIIILSLIGFFLVCVFWIIRMHFNIEKTKINYQEVTIPEEKMNEIGQMLKNRLLDISELAGQLKNARLLLVGEAHLQNEVMAYFTELLDHLPDDRLVLCLELPVLVQSLIDTYMNGGEESYLDSLGTIKGCLPYQQILRWCYQNQERIEKVLAIDETQKQIRFNRKYLCTDTRNRIMYKRILKAYHEYPNAKVIFYGGQLHALKSGRYKFDIKNRVTAGSRLMNSGIPKDDIRVIMIDGEDGFPLSAAWQGKIGVMKTVGELGRIPYNYFYSYPVYRVSYAEDMFDYFVNVGKTTQLER